MLVLTTPRTVYVQFTLYLAEVYIRSCRCLDANFVKILSRVNELLPLIRLKKFCFNLFLLTRSFFHFNKNKTIPIFVNTSLLYLGKMKVFRGKLESACLSIHVYVCPFVCVQNTSVFQSTGRAIKSCLVTALVQFFCLEQILL